jgi:hypothetical protein
MDPVRQIRLLIPPFFFFGSLLTGWFTSNIHCHWNWLKNQNITTITGIVAIIGIASLPIGFLLSTMTLMFLKFFRYFGWTYETGLTENELSEIWPLLDTRLGRNNNRGLYLLTGERTSNETRWHASVEFVHNIIQSRSKGIFEWMSRAYSAFWICSCSLTSLVLTIVVLLFGKITPPAEWWYINGFLIIIMGIGALLARRDVINMERFQTLKNFIKTDRKIRIDAKKGQFYFKKRKK